MNSQKSYNSQPYGSSHGNLKQGVTLEAGETIQVGGKTLQIEFLTKANGEKVAQLKELGNASGSNHSNYQHPKGHHTQHSGYSK